MSLRFLDEAQAELLAAIGHYAEEDLELAIDFDKAVDERLETATKMPGAGRLEGRAPERFDLRWYRIRRFPYALLIGTVHGERVVVALAHERRRPGYWRKRLQ